MTRLTGHEAIEYAGAHGLTLKKHADPIEGAREGLTLEAAARIVAEDPSLIYIDATPTYRVEQWHDNRWTTEGMGDDDAATGWTTPTAAREGIRIWAQDNPSWRNGRYRVVNEDTGEVALTFEEDS